MTSRILGFDQRGLPRDFVVGDRVMVIDLEASHEQREAEGLKGTVRVIDSLFVRVAMDGDRTNTTPWYPHHLVLLDSHEEAVEILGEDYFA